MDIMKDIVSKHKIIAMFLRKSFRHIQRAFMKVVYGHLKYHLLRNMQGIRYTL